MSFTKQNAMELEIKSKTLLEPKGQVSFWRDDRKTITVDGEIYEKLTRSNVTKTWGDIEKEYTQYMVNDEHDFEFTDYKFTIKDNKFLSSKSVLSIEYSSDPFVNRLMNAKRTEFFDDKKINIFTSKNSNGFPAYSGTFTDIYNDILKTQSIDIQYHNYGWSNCVFYNIPVKNIFNVDPEIIPYEVYELFKNNGIDLKSNKIDEQWIKFFNQSLLTLKK